MEPKVEERGISLKRREYVSGVSLWSKGYKLYDLNEKKLFLSRDVVFQEEIFPFLNPTIEKDAMKLHFNSIPGCKFDAVQVDESVNPTGNEHMTEGVCTDAEIDAEEQDGVTQHHEKTQTSMMKLMSQRDPKEKWDK